MSLNPCRSELSLLAALLAPLSLVAAGCSDEDPGQSNADAGDIADASQSVADASQDAADAGADAAVEQFAVGGTISGLLGTLALTNGVDTITVDANGAWSFPTPLPVGTTYVVLVAAQPQFSDAGVEQICTVANASGPVRAGGASNVDVTCSTESFSVSGRVHGLQSGATLTLHNNGADALEIEGTEASSLTFRFPTPVASGAPFDVTIVPVVEEPAGNTSGSAVEQRCEVSEGSGVVSGGDVTGIEIHCEAVLHTVRVKLSGLLEDAWVAVQNRRTATEATPAPSDNSEALVLDENGVYAFVSGVASGQTYTVTVAASSEHKPCEVGDHASGTIGNEDVEVTVTCKGCGEGGPCRVFATSEMHTGALGGLSGADSICQRLAEAASLPGNYKAWLSDATDSPSTRFVQSPGPYVRIDGSLFAEDWASLTSDGPRVRLEVNEKGDLLTNGMEAWTNTKVDGTPYSTTLSLFCSNWASGDNPVSGRVGELNQLAEGWTSGHADPCNVPWRLYCFQQN